MNTDDGSFRNLFEDERPGKNEAGPFNVGSVQTIEATVHEVARFGIVLALPATFPILEEPFQIMHAKRVGDRFLLSCRSAASLTPEQRRAQPVHTGELEKLREDLGGALGPPPRVTRGPRLIEDEDGAPLPHEEQPVARDPSEA